MKTTPVILSLMVFAFCQLSAIPGLAEKPKELSQLRFEFHVELAELEKNEPLQELNGKYRGYLEKQKAAYQQAGNLEAMLAVDEEVKSFEDDPGKTLSQLPELKRLQGIYREQRKKLESELNEKKLALIQSSAKKAKELSAEWTQEGKLEEAKLALDESKSIAAMASDLSSVRAIPQPTASERDAPVADSGADDRKVGGEMKNSLRMKLCWIPAGKFTMGSPESEPGREAGKERQVEVELTRGFWIGKYEVTQEEYEKVMDENPSKFKGVGKRAPVERVDWEDATAFCEALTERERKRGDLPDGWVYTLPTEAQWEYACRAGEKGSYSGGGLDEVAWYKDNGDDTTHEVGEKKGNAWGLHDMHGNVREWCQDAMANSLTGGKDPTGPGVKPNSIRIHRGGGAHSEGQECRAAHRFGNPPTFWSYFFGFRVCLRPE